MALGRFLPFSGPPVCKIRGFGGRSLRAGARIPSYLRDIADSHADCISWHCPGLTLLHHPQEVSRTGPQGLHFDLEKQIAVAISRILGEEAMGGYPPLPPPPSLCTKSAPALHPTCHLAFSVSSIIHYLFVNSMKDYFPWVWTSKNKKEFLVMGTASPFPFFSGSFLISSSTLSALGSAPTPTLSRTKA